MMHRYHLKIETKRLMLAQRK